MNSHTSSHQPVFAVEDSCLIPSSDHLAHMAPIPASRMFLINKALRAYLQKFPDQPLYDASQGDGGASLSGVPRSILERAALMQIDQGTAYDMPYGSDAFRRAVVEKYWRLDSSLGLGPANIVATVGGRDGLVKAFQAMLSLGYARQGDALIVSRVPWISYNWGPYGVGANVLYAPGEALDGWAFSEESLLASIRYAARYGRNVAGVLITSPDNPTGRTISPEAQANLGRAALEAGAAFIIYDWIYHYITDEAPMDLNYFLRLFDPEERQRLIFLDGLTKSLGGSNIRNAHLVCSEDVARFIVARASHSVIPSYFSLAVAIAAYEMGYADACRSIVGPTNESRIALQSFLDLHGFTYILGKGYYAFINVGKWITQRGWQDSEPLGQYLAEEHGVAIVPGVYFSIYGGDWIRFSYATPVEHTVGAAQRLLQGLQALVTEAN